MMPRVLAFIQKELVNVIDLSSANEGLVCHESDGDTYDTGVCTRLVKYARRNHKRAMSPLVSLPVLRGTPATPHVHAVTR